MVAPLLLEICMKAPVAFWAGTVPRTQASFTSRSAARVEPRAVVPSRSRADLTSTGFKALCILAPLPQHVTLARGAIEYTAQHEQQVGQAVEVLARGVIHCLVLGQRHHAAFSPPA